MFRKLDSNTRVKDIRSALKSITFTLSNCSGVAASRLSVDDLVPTPLLEELEQRSLKWCLQYLHAFTCVFSIVSGIRSYSINNTYGLDSIVNNAICGDTHPDLEVTVRDCLRITIMNAFEKIWGAIHKTPLFRKFSRLSSFCLSNIVEPTRR